MTTEIIKTPLFEGRCPDCGDTFPLNTERSKVESWADEHDANCGEGDDA